MESAPPLTRPHLIECQDCGTIQRLPAMPAQSRAVCPRCDAFLRHTRVDPFSLPLALNLAALVMLDHRRVAWTLLSVSTAGQSRAANLLTGPISCGASGCGNCRSSS
jgi:paraquat-inducible protein A